MDLTLNLASSDVRKRRRLRHLAVGGLCLNLLLGVGNFLLYRSSRADLQSAEVRLHRVQEAVRQREDSLAALPQRLSPKEMKRFGARIALYNRIIQGANFSWTRLLFELERAIPAHVTLSEIQPDFGEGSVTLSGTAQTMEDVLRCVQRLKERDAFRQVYLLNHAVEKGNTSVRFTVSLHYQGEAA
ncbi:MAG: PilN domain-containing protein [Candidatus Methylomirabilales bacterium]